MVLGQTALPLEVLLDTSSAGILLNLPFSSSHH